MRIAVIADTHDRYPDKLLNMLMEADAIWHLGDVCDPLVLLEFESLGKPVRVVRGNCDSELKWPLTMDLKEQGVSIRLVHIPPKTAPDGFDLLLHGHTHVPRDEMVGKTRFLNPGCITRPNRGAPPSFGWLTLRTGYLPEWRLVVLT